MNNDMTNQVSISYTILTHNEDVSLEFLLKSIEPFIQYNDEIIIVDDNSDNTETIRILNEWGAKDFVKVFQRSLNNNFADQKNFLTEKANNQWILNLDADETIHEHFLKNIRDLLSINNEIEAYLIPRINIVEGLTFEHISKWNWYISGIDTQIEKRHVTDQEELKILKVYNLIKAEDNGVYTFQTPLVNFPDYQWRLYKKSDSIYWRNAVHEQLYGYKTYAKFPATNIFSIYHKKNIKKQEQQNDFYTALMHNK